MRPVEAKYEGGLLRPAEPLPLRPGESVTLIVVRRPDPARWDMARLAASAAEDEELARTGLEEWADELDREDEGEAR